MNSEAGFTLVEVMVATFITAILMLMGTALISDTLRTRDTLAAAIVSAEELELAGVTLREDMAQLVPRRARADFGGPADAPFLGGLAAPDNALVAFVRTGNVFPGLELPGSRLQYVEYHLVDGDLVRRTRNFVDAVPGTPQRERVVLQDVGDIEVSFLSNGQWSDIWPLYAVTGTELVPPPSAMSLRFAHPRYGMLDMTLQTGYSS